MTTQEFTSRTKVEISANPTLGITPEEFEAIHTVYVNSDLDKDEFCRAWKRMNRTRIAAFKEARKAWKERLQRNGRIAGIREHLRQLAANDKGQNHCKWYLNEANEADLNAAGIDYEYLNVWNLLSAIHDYFEAA